MTETKNSRSVLTKYRIQIRNITFSALFLALALLLPFLTGQIPQIGALLSPMHIPAFLCGYVCGPIWGAVVGLVSPLMRCVIFHMPPVMVALPMAVELAAYGAIAGVLYKILPKKAIWLYSSLGTSMLGGRVIYSAVKMAMLGLSGEAFTPWLIFADTVTGTWAGIIVQFIVIPPLVMVIDRFVIKKSM